MSVQRCLGREARDMRRCVGARQGGLGEEAGCLVLEFRSWCLMVKVQVGTSGLLAQGWRGCKDEAGMIRHLPAYPAR